MIDLLVAGAGPVGLATALYAARAGLETVVIDPRTGPIDKACGEGLMPGAVAALAGLDVHPVGSALAGIRYTGRGGAVEARFRSGPGLGVRRLALQDAMLAQVAARGIPIVHERVHDVRQDESGVTAAGLRARYLAAADGLHSPLRRELGLSLPVTTPVAPRWGLRQHFAIEPWTDFVEVHWSTHSEAYVTPVGPGLVGVALLSSQQAPWADQLAAFPALAARLPATAATAVRGAGPLRQASSGRVSGRVLLVGDAAGYVDALTGEGIAVGVHCAEALVAAVVADSPLRYEAAWLRHSRRYRTITSALLWARSRPHGQRLVLGSARRAPALFSVAVQQLAR